ncbi:DNA helicase-4 [Xylanibacter ruminicola]|uniref:DNA 3'-5' helicase n=2 Tax=Xylanibacter ruminicola TaxID=839 RepID=A0A1H5WLJ3_XYLRU|nr:DNA helicase-4 [Xylanibacter ruminicola]
MEFRKKLMSIQEIDKYIARSDYSFLREHFSDTYTFFENTKRANALEYYCEKNALEKRYVDRFLVEYEDVCLSEESKIIAKHNEQYVQNHLNEDKDYLDGILEPVDPKIKLDDEQRRVVLSDEDYTLVIAGAGAGKTTTVSAKVRYLVEKKGITPEQILVISFTNKAVGELQEKINKKLGIPCPVTTFHKTGYAIMRRQDAERRMIVDQGFMFNVINNYLKGNILENPELVDKLILFFGSYFDAPYEGDNLNDFFNYISKADFSTIRGNIDEYSEMIINERTGKCQTIARETLRSAQEVQIANFLFLNGIEYVYEKPYPYSIASSYKIYTPDFTITQGDKIAYIEHFGITQDGRNSRYNAEQISKYKREVNDKVKLHKKHGTDLIYTFSEYSDSRSLLDHLKEDLTAHGFELHPRPSKEVFEKIVNTEENRYISRLVSLVCTFIQNFKTNGYTTEKFFAWNATSRNERTKLFLTICEQCYHEYTKCLKERRAIDFEDMINDSARILREAEEQKLELNFKYIIVDEYQDISRQRFDLTKELSQLCDAKIIAVGDDWQSIYAYAGSDITLFTHFKDTFGYGQELRITKTYRNAQEIIDIAGGFIQKNSEQIQKALISPKHISNPVIIQTYTEEVDRKQYEGRGGKFFLVGETVEKLMKEILAENPKSSILLLGRYGFDGFNLTRSADFQYWEKTGNVTSKTFADIEMEFMTVHRAKGLGYDNVIIINAIDSIYGFPSKIQEDPILQYVVKTDRSIEYAEERRLFYVALTRTKNRVYIVTPQQRPSEFVRELLKDYPNVTLRGQLDERLKSSGDIKHCPICGYPLQLRYKKAYGLKLWMCSNEPEICDFLTNDIKGGDMSIIKCDQCKDGYLIVKQGKNSPFLGCTNYTVDGKGCNRMMTYKEYRNLINQIKSDMQ